MKLKKNVIQIDNKVKHQAYIPQKIDCIIAIKSVEELFKKLKDEKIELSDEIKRKIYEGL
jgi:hypothetical protein